MTRRAGVLLVIGLAAVVAVAYGPQAPTVVEPKFSAQQCQAIAADFLGVRAEELTRDERCEGPSDRRPPRYAFWIPYGDTAPVREGQRLFGQVQVWVDGLSGEVVFAEHAPRRFEIGPQQLGQEEARRIAEGFLEAHWAHWHGARLQEAGSPMPLNQRSDFPTAPQQWFRWVVEEDGIRTGRAEVNLNLSTGEDIYYVQRYYSAQGLAPPRLTKEQAISEALGKLDSKRRQKAQFEEAYLATRWYKGDVGLSWQVRLRAPAPVPDTFPGEPWMQSCGFTLDAYTGELLSQTGPEL